MHGMRALLAFPCILLLACGGSTTSSSTPTDSGPAAQDTSIDSALAPDVTSDTSSDAIDSTPVDSPAGDASSCIADRSAGAHVYDCDGFKYDVQVPAACTSPGCGIVLDVHGFTMSGKMEDDNTNMRALGETYGYVVVQPNANPAPPAASWNPSTDDDKVFAFFMQAVDAFAVDRNKLHMTGFSQGGMMSSRFLCKHADVFASIAPGAGTGCSFSGSDTPARQIDVLYMHGTKDALVPFSQGTAQRDALVAAWGMGSETTVESDGAHTWSRWTNASGTTFEFIQHDYQAATPILGGHCFPGSTDKGGEPGQLFPFNCVGTTAFTWGEAAMKFFRAHPRAH